MYPGVSLEHLQLDDAVMRKLPRHLAYYHLAIPIGIDDEGITVAMAQPDNIKAHEVIQNALRQPIIVVQSEADEIRRILDILWSVAETVPWQHIVISSHDPVTEYYARQFANFFGSQIIHESSVSGNNVLFIQHFSESMTLEPFSSTLLVNRVKSINRVLQLVRLHTPDRLVVSSLAPLIKSETVEVTLLPDATSAASNLAYLLDDSSPQGQHLEKLKHQLVTVGITGRLRLRQTQFAEAVRAELAEQDYDLVAVAADAYGEIVQTLVSTVQLYDIPAMMIIKPDLR